VTNPLDVMAYVGKKVTGWPRERVFGMAGILDTARMRSFIAMELNVSVESVQALVLGGHGDSMVPLPRLTTVGGVPLTELLAQDRIDAIVERTRKGGGEIVSLLKTGSAYYAPAASAVEIVESILHDKKKILPCAAWLEGEYGLEGVYAGVPVVVGAKGMERIIEIKLSEDELGALQESAGHVKEQQAKLDV
ncbi:MAG: malate dehydrogenase, partial [Acidobacteriota bacterium]|nr:malate dehydrogenase [Acidobacteriota bacterium]